MSYKVGDKVRDRETNKEYVIVCETTLTYLAYCYSDSNNYTVLSIGKNSETMHNLEPITDYLTTEEFIKEAEALGYEAEVLTHVINIRDPNNMTGAVAKVYKDYIFSMDADWNAYHCLKDEDKEKLYNLLDRYARTPLGKRAVEKRFYLMLPDIGKGEDIYLERIDWHDDGWTIATKPSKSYCEAEILELQERFPKINFDKLEREVVE